MIESIHGSLGVGWKVPPIINAFNVSSGLSAREAAAENIEIDASNSTGGAASDAALDARRGSVSLKNQALLCLSTRQNQRGRTHIAALGDHPPPLVERPSRVRHIGPPSGRCPISGTVASGGADPLRNGPLLGRDQLNMAVDCQIVEREARREWQSTVKCYQVGRTRVVRQPASGTTELLALHAALWAP
jgi:hypothetical protein